MLLSSSSPPVISTSLCFYLFWAIASVNAIPLSQNPLNSAATHDSSRPKLPQSLSLYLFTCNGQAVSLESGKNLAFENKSERWSLLLDPEQGIGPYRPGVCAQNDYAVVKFLLSTESVMIEDLRNHPMLSRKFESDDNELRSYRLLNNQDIPQRLEHTQNLLNSRDVLLVPAPIGEKSIDKAVMLNSKAVSSPAFKYLGHETGQSVEETWSRMSKYNAV
ncbi:hypothetical protein EV368DRAFT_82467 [Lentinula lateritia]|uniref:Uncharacterized protein n=1 Tax=Lentinula aff. lateritia TaxID=2804960 RepID=A0ACC1TRW1_9AGAR|nr:hypothetical protein F5876DRAFT_79682 [Lentinula aff. lateritia]KAJ3852517.1 hypothetical protein EV368DRAFT_82467 [Lentinula lateritia]